MVEASVTSILNFPSKSVIVPLVVPLVETLHPISGSPEVASLTDPLICSTFVAKALTFKDKERTISKIPF